MSTVGALDFDPSKWVLSGKLCILASCFLTQISRNSISEELRVEGFDNRKEDHPGLCLEFVFVSVLPKDNKRSSSQHLKVVSHLLCHRHRRLLVTGTSHGHLSWVRQQAG